MDYHLNIASAIREVSDIIILDYSGRIVYANENICKKIGQELKYILGTPYSHYLANENTESHFDEIWQGMVAAPKTWMGELKHISHEGSPFWTFTVAIPQQKTEENESSYIFMGFDITATKNRSILSELENTKLRTVFDNSEWALYVLDEDMNVLDVNRNALEDLKKQPGKNTHPGKHVYEYIHPSYHELVHKYILRCLRGFDSKFIHKENMINGHNVWYELLFTAIHASQHRKNIIFGYRDITHIQMQKELLQESYSKLVEIGRISSHELRGPLATLKGLFALYEYECENSTHTQDLVGMMKKTLDDLDDKVHSMVKMSYNRE